MNYQFQNTAYIWALVGVPFFIILFFLLVQWKKKIIRKTGDKHLVKELIGNFSSGKYLLKFILLTIAFAFGVVGLMNPRKPGASNNRDRKGIDVAITLDVSKSMLATDLQPFRLERAKQFINKLMNEMPNDRIALILFAGKAYLQMPLTIDHNAARMFVSSASPASIPQQGTVISEALRMSAQIFNSADRRFKAVVLITDGENHEEEALKTAKELATQGVMINTLGIGSPEGTTLMDSSTGQLKRDETGSPVVTKLNENLLKELATETNGVYIRLQGSDEAVSELKKHLAQIDRKSFGDVSLMNFTTYYGWLAAAMFLFLLLENLISERKKVLA